MYIEYIEGGDNRVFKDENFKYFNPDDIKENEKGELFYNNKKIFINKDLPGIGKTEDGILLIFNIDIKKPFNREV